MKDVLEKVFSLGLGIAAAGREQIERIVEDLVKKGEISQAESKGLVEDLMKKGEEAQKKIEEIARQRLHAILGDVATKEDIARIEQRLQALEQKIARD